MSKIFLASMLAAMSFSNFSNAKTKNLVCEFEQTILNRAANNACFQKLITKMIDVDDRKWLLQLSKTWNPDPSMKVVMVPGGIVVFKNNVQILDARWIYSDPLVLAWNGTLIVGKGETKTSSVKKFLYDLIDQKSERAFGLNFFMSSAYAVDSTEFKDIFTLYTFGGEDRLDAAALIKKLSNTSGLFPERSFVERNWSGRDLKCGSNGQVDEVIYDFGTQKMLLSLLAKTRSSKPVRIKANSSLSFEIKGMFGARGEKTIIAEPEPLATFSDSKTRVYDAAYFAGGTSGPSGIIWKYKYFFCEDVACKKRTQITSWEELEKLAQADLRSHVPLGIETALLGMSALSNCCKSESCRKVAAEKIRINLKPNHKGSSTAK